ncbi:MAG TPA: hypothetical protein VGR34_06665 [Candidatus Dormibacteraeota bacterium]|nr:hypothetical protein [Candidatus Dormibacteraeota bacterium]
MAALRKVSSRWRRLAGGAAVGMTVLMVLTACDAPFGVGLPTTRALETGAVDTLTAANSFEITGSYAESNTLIASSARSTATTATWSIDLQVTRPATQHAVVSTTGLKLEAIVLGSDAYFRGNEFLSQHMGSDPLSRNLVKVAGNAWWKGSSSNLPSLPDFTDGATFRSTFLGPAVTERTDHMLVDGLDAVELSGPRADVFIAANPPYQLLRVHLKRGAVIDGISDGDLQFKNFGQDFHTVAPTDVIDFSNLSTLPPIYSVVSIDTSGCGSPCAVSALLKNLGGMTGAQSPSTVTFTITESASRQVLASCKALVQPDVAYNSTTRVGCTMAGLNNQQVNAATVTATAENPGRA